MKKYLMLLVIFYYVMVMFPVAASGKKDSGVSTYLNNEWILCITAFDYSLLPPGQRIAGDVITRSLVDKLKTVNYRLRISPEYAYYEGYAWQQSISTAAKAVSTKQTERSQLLYRGDPDWKYRSNLKKIDADLKKLNDALAEKEAARPLIHSEPSFMLNQANINGSYPEPPNSGGERRFCQNQKSDAFLTGELREFHGRYYIKLQLFTLYTNSYVYDDDIIFSMEDTDGAVDEIASRLIAVLSGTRPARVAVTAEPAESQVLINHSYAGRGTVEAREYPPGRIAIAVTAEAFSPMMIETELVPGEHVDVAVALSPLQYADVHVNVPDGDGSSVYLGALYMGESPLSLSLPLNQLEYVTVEKRKEMAKAVFTTPDLPTNALSFSLKTKIPPPSGEQRVNKARRWYYWAWGGTWLTGITAWITYGIYSSQNDVLTKSSDPAFYDSTRAVFVVSIGAMAAVGAAIGYEFFQMGRYLYTATENVTPVIKQGANKK